MYTANGDGGHTNGSSRGYMARRDLDASSLGSSADERSQSRGPHSRTPFARQAPDDYGRRVEAPAHLDRRHAHRRSGDAASCWSGSRSRSRGPPAARYDYGESGKQVEGWCACLHHASLAHAHTYPM